MKIQELFEGSLHKVPSFHGDMKDLFEGTNDIKSLNKTRGYQGEVGHETAEGDKKFKAMHAFAKKELGSAMALKDAKNPNIMIRDFLDSNHGRHLADSEKNAGGLNNEFTKELVKSFKKFKPKYNPEDYT